MSNALSAAVGVQTDPTAALDYLDSLPLEEEEEDVPDEDDEEEELSDFVSLFLPLFALPFPLRA